MSNWILAIILLVASIFLIVAVLIQQGKDARLSGSIAGSSSDTYYGKTKNRTRDKILSRITTIVAILFIVVVIVVYAIQTTDNTQNTEVGDQYDNVFDQTEAVDDTRETTGTAAATDASDSAAASDTTQTTAVSETTAATTAAE